MNPPRLAPAIGRTPFIPPPCPPAPGRRRFAARRQRCRPAAL